MARMNGERWEAYQQRRRFAIEAAVATRAYEVQRSVMRAEGLALPVIEAPVPCTCAARPFPHFHAEEDQRRQRFRFEHRQPPPDSQEGK
jgi:hypothetical protein